MKLSLSLLGLSWVEVVYAACSSNLIVDNYAKWSTNTNALGQYTSDDGTTTNIKADVANKKITFTSKASSYFYTTFACEQATTDGYNAITFPIKGPAGASFTLELQASTSCATTAYSSYFTTLNGVTGATQTFTVPLSSFGSANLNAINGLVWEGFSINGAWEIGQSQLICGASSASTQSSLISGSGISSRISASSSQVVTTLSSSSSFVTKTIPSSKSVSSSGIKVVSSTTSSSPAGTCTPVLIDDFASQSRLTFLFYNAMLQPSSDDGTMAAVANRVDTSTSVIVLNNHVTLTPKDSSSYWYTELGCLKATGKYGGLGMTIKAAAGTTFGIELQTSTACTTDNPVLNDVLSSDLDWTFDGTEKYYTIPFSKFPGLDTDHVVAVLFSGLNKAITLGPIAAYCGNTGSAYPIPTTVQVIEPSSTVPATTGTTAFVVDTFGNQNTNTLGFYHGGDDTTHFKISASKLTVNTQGNSDLSWYSQITDGCKDITANDNGYVHIVYSGSNAFTIALQQHNPTCNQSMNPFPFTWDSVEASRYSNSAKTDIYIPLSHFNINRKIVVGFALKGFYTSTASIFTKIEIVQSAPSGFLIPSKLPTAPLLFACTRPNSFAFAIDDGDPQYAQQVVSSVAAAGIHVTFFTVGAALLDVSTNLSSVYNGMLAAGHQVAYHSYTHPPMEGLPTLAGIDWELTNDIAAVQKTLGISSTYFRPPFGTEGARVRQRLAAQIPNSKFVAWSVDVQDYLWALSDTPEKQLESFQNDVKAGGNLVVMHYLYNTTVNYIPQFIKIAKATGKQLMRVDQCMEDPNAPPL